ncbi:hypothetical protein GCM10009020_35140 [Natronoarchaeum mannanilyticum]|uniref:Lipoprotein n=1 Tax=Natronoarchaeum mannanilyticum TaxID=926360 RepID=A0AAV3TFA0_9EURY
MSSSRRSVLQSVFFIGLLSTGGCTDLADNGVPGLSKQTKDQQRSSREESKSDSITESKCSSDIRLRLDSVLKSDVDEDSTNPIQYSNLSTNEKQLVESATNLEKCVHPNRRPEISLLESRIKQRNDEGSVYLRWEGFYYRVYYENGSKELAS